ncbi:hypothetical protein JZ751_022369 [Albula glossodonta]|uniref:Uncharacterized protein n=1 Tax=Albula glossodonta TaxID=121402 RepID=A0A8T2NIL5_9TELE|nr:hypothetical protein JZ751_022369 [Albula glossodonta]
MGFIPLPLALLLIRVVTSSVKIQGSLSFVCVLLFYLGMITLKVLNSIVLLGKSCLYVKEANMEEKLFQTPPTAAPGKASSKSSRSKFTSPPALLFQIYEMLAVFAFPSACLLCARSARAPTLICVYACFTSLSSQSLCLSLRVRALPSDSPFLSTCIALCFWPGGLVSPLLPTTDPSAAASPKPLLSPPPAGFLPQTPGRALHAAVFLLSIKSVLQLAAGTHMLCNEERGLAVGADWDSGSNPGDQGVSTSIISQPVHQAAGPAPSPAPSLPTSSSDQFLTTPDESEEKDITQDSSELKHRAPKKDLLEIDRFTICGNRID